MKKTLLLSMAFAAVFSANAQESSQVNYKVLRVDAEKTKVAISAGTEFAKTENVTLTAAFDDQYQYVGANGPKIDETSYKTVIVNGKSLFEDDYGLQGNTNPTGASGGNSANVSEAPTAGAVYKFTIGADGYLYVIHKASSNKQYQVSEGDKNGYSPIGYKFVASTDGSKASIPTAYGYDLQGYQLEGEKENLGHLPAGYKVEWPEVYYTGDAASAVKQNGLGVIKVPVYEGLEYLVNACGSKMTLLGYYFDKTGDANISIQNGVSADIVLLEKGEPVNCKAIDVKAAFAAQTAGINDVVAAKAENAVLYNLAGQKVSKDYKGVVIANGKKFIQK